MSRRARPLSAAARPVLFDALEGRQLLATTYYVAPWGNDSRSGTSESAAWKSIDKVNAKSLRPGDKVLLAGGQTFSGKTLTLHTDDYGTSSQPITIGSYGSGRATIYNDKGKGIYVFNTPGVRVENLIVKSSGAQANSLTGLHFQNGSGSDKSFVRVDKVDVVGWGMYGLNVQGTSGSGGWKDVRITNVNAYGNGYVGINFQGPGYTRDSNNDVYVGHNKAYDNPGRTDTNSPTGSGIKVSGTTNAVVEYNEAYNNGSKGNAGTGIWSTHAQNITFQHNSSHDNKAGRGQDGGGYDMDGGVINGVMQYNYSANNQGAGLAALSWAGGPETRNITMRYNVSQNDGRQGGYAGIAVGANSGKMNDIFIHNNAVYMNKPASGDARLIWTHHRVPNIQIKNNIFYGDGVNMARFRDNSGLTIRGNVWYTTKSNAAYEHNGKWYTSFAAWQSAAGVEKLNGKSTAVTSSPKLLRAGKAPTAIAPTALKTTLDDYYAVGSGSPVLDRGVALNFASGAAIGAANATRPTVDFFGNANNRSGDTPDIGIHERA